MSRIVIYENILRMLITSAFPIALVFEMSRFRSRRKARAAMTAVFLAAGSVNVVLFLLAGHERMKQLYAVILFVPCILYLLAASKDWLSQHLFNFFYCGECSLFCIHIISLHHRGRAEGRKRGRLAGRGREGASVPADLILVRALSAVAVPVSGGKYEKGELESICGDSVLLFCSCYVSRPVSPCADR